MAPSKKVFISYRRDDAPTAAHLLCERLADRYGSDQVFFDVDSIPFGTDFHGYISEQIRDCRVLVVVIGRHWVDIRDDNGERRLDSPQDFVRIEIETALNCGMPIVPVLVENATIPKAADLPGSIRALIRKHAAQIQPGSMFRHQISAFLTGIEPLFELERKPPKPKVVEEPVVAEPVSEPAVHTRPETDEDSYLDEKTGIEFVRIKAGQFMMGSDVKDAEKPVHEVVISRDYWLAKYPVTNEQYKRFMDSESSAEEPSWWDNSKFNKPNQPVVGISWNAVDAFCRWSGMRLPTEAEWEYACRAGTTSNYSFGDDAGLLPEYGWFNENTKGATHDVGQKHANPWGLYDMHGNVREWCADFYGKYNDARETDPTGPSSGSARVLRGGSWGSHSTFCRSAARLFNRPAYRFSVSGFRVART